MNTQKKNRRHTLTLAIPKKCAKLVRVVSQKQDGLDQLNYEYVKEDFTNDDYFDKKFKLLQKIGEGTRGVVKKCYQISNPDQIYAVKVMQMDDEQAMLMKKNFKTIRNLSHQNIINYKALYLNRKQFSGYLVMDYYSHPNLVGVIMQEQQLKSTIYKILKAVSYLHMKGICHRDLKTQNILYSPESKQIKVIDFGICKEVVVRGKRQEMFTATGTLKYKAPEMFLGGGYDEQVDIWALGVIMYELVTGKNPFEAEYVSQIINNITNNEVSLQDDFKNYSKLCQSILQHMLSKSRINRLTVHEALNHLWFSQNTNKINNFQKGIFLSYKPQKTSQQNKIKTILVKSNPHQTIKPQMQFIASDQQEAIYDN